MINCVILTLSKREKGERKMKFLKIAATLILSVSAITLVSAPKLPEAQAQQLIEFDTPMVITVKR